MRLLSVFPILLLAFALRHGRARSWPFARALVPAAGMLAALVEALP